MMKCGSLEKRLPPFFTAFRTAFSNNEAFEVYIGLKIDASRNNMGTEDVRAAIEDLPDTIPEFELHIENNKVPASPKSMKVSEICVDNSYQANTVDVNTKFSHLANASNICLKKSQIGAFSMNTHETDASKMNTHYQTSVFQNCFAYASNMSANIIHQQTHMSKNTLEDVCPKNAHEANPIKMNINNFHQYPTNASENSLADTTKMSSNIIHRQTHLSKNDPAYTHYLQSKNAHVADALKVLSKNTSQANSTKMNRDNSYHSRTNATKSSLSTKMSSSIIHQQRHLSKNEPAYALYLQSKNAHVAEALKVLSKNTSQADAPKVFPKKIPADSCSINSREANASEKHPEVTHQEKASELCQEKGVMCDICDTKLKWRNHPKAHLRITHKGEKPYRCKVCQGIVLPTEWSVQSS